MKRMWKFCLLIVVVWFLFDGVFVLEALKAAGAEEVKFIPMEATAYCYGTTRCDGGEVRTGICAAKPEWYGKVAAVYENAGGEPGEFLGYYECLDTGGQDIRDGRVIDIYHPSQEWCIQFGRKNVLVVLMDGVG